MRDASLMRVYVSFQISTAVLILSAFYFSYNPHLHQYHGIYLSPSLLCLLCQNIFLITDLMVFLPRPITPNYVVIALVSFLKNIFQLVWYTLTEESLILSTFRLLYFSTSTQLPTKIPPSKMVVVWYF